jgi:tetratricopeptide (TPR) repeat protein
MSVGAAYDSTGASILPPSESVAGQERAALLEEAGTLFNAGDYAGAREKAELVLKKYSGDATTIYLVGRSYLMEGNYTQAQKYLSRASALAPDSTEVSTDLKAAKILSLGEKAAVEEVKRLLSDNTNASQGLQIGVYVIQEWPENLSVRLAMADYYTNIGRVDYTGGIYVEALKEVPAEDQGPLLKKIEELALSHDDDPSAHDLLAQAYANAGRLAEAENEFDRALDLSEDDILFQSSLKKDFADVYARLGQEALVSGDDVTAVKYMEQALHLSWSSDRKSQLADMHIQLGEQALRQGLTGDALKAFGKAASYLPSDEDETDERRGRLINDYERLAAKLTGSGDLRRAVFARQGAYNLDTDDEDNKRRLADANDTYGLWLFDHQRYNDAIRAFRAALALYPDDEDYSAHLDDAEAAE